MKQREGKVTDKMRMDWLYKNAFDVHQTNSVFGRWVCGIICRRGLHISIYGKSPRAAIDAAISSEIKSKKLTKAAIRAERSRP